MFTTTSPFFTATIMISPKTSAGTQLKTHYESLIEEIQNSDGAFAKSGPESRAQKINELRKEYNSELAKIEKVSQEEITEASRPQMIAPKTEGGKQLKEKYDNKIIEVEGNTSLSSDVVYEKVNELRTEYNNLLDKVEGN